MVVDEVVVCEKTLEVVCAVPKPVDALTLLPIATSVDAPLASSVVVAIRDEELLVSLVDVSTA
jgi:hypothetical protein